MAGNSLHDLGAIIGELETSGRLARVRSDVDLRHELAGLAATLEGGPRAVLFERVRGQRWPVLAGLYGGRGLVASLLGQEEKSLATFLAARVAAWQRAPGQPTVTKQGPVLEATAPDVDLGKIPIPVHALKDAGPCLTAAVAIAKDPESGARHASMPRCQVVNRDTLHIDADAGGAFATYLERAKRMGRSLWLTLNIGAGPALQLAALAPASAAESGGDALGLAGEIAGIPLALVPGMESDVEMAADAMWALECEIVPGEFAPTGPFGAGAGSYTTAEQRPVAHVRRMHGRAAPVFHTILSGAETRTCAGLIGEASVLAQLQRLVPGVRDVHFTPGGAGLYHAVVQIEQQRAGWPKQAILAAFAAYPPLKMVTVVDDDVDIRNARDVEWAMAARLDPAAGIVTIAKAFGGCKVGFDATQPFPKRAEYERVAFKAVALEAYEIVGADAMGAARAVAVSAAADVAAPRLPVAAAADPAPARPGRPSSDYDTDRIWQRELAEWKTGPVGEAAPAPAAKAAATTDWDENRWWKRELEELKREREGRKPAPAARSAKPAPARPPAPTRPAPAARPAEPRRMEAQAAESRAGDDDDGGFFRGGPA